MNAAVTKKIAAVFVAAAVCLTGCSGANNGGKTTCGDYRKMNSSSQSAVVTKMLQEQGQSSPANGTITLAKLSVSAYCATVGTDSSTIDNVNHG